MTDPTSAAPPPIGRLSRITAGSVVFREGDMGDCAYIVRDGVVDIQRETGNGPQYLASINTGEVFGEIALMTNQPRTATALARTDVTLEVVDRAAMVGLFASSPDLAYQIVGRLAGLVTAQKVELLSAAAPKADDEDEDRPPTPGLLGRLRRLIGWDREPADDPGFIPDHLVILSERPPLAMRMTGWLVLALLAGGIAWASFAQIDVVVNGRGKLVSVVPPVTVQPSNSGTIRQMLVRNGQVVRKGDPVVVLDGTASEADLQSMRSELRAVEATVRRLQAELSGSRPARFSDNEGEEEVQTRLYESRRLKLAAGLASRDAEIQSLTTQIAREQEEQAVMVRQAQQQAQVTAIRKDFYEREKDLFRREGPNQIQYLEAEQRRLSMQHDLAAARKRTGAMMGQLEGRRAEREAFLNEARAASNEALANALREQARLIEQLKKTELAFAQVRLTAPYDAVVFDVAEKTGGSFVTPGEVLARLVALDAPLEVAVDIDPKDIAFVTPGDSVMIKFDALPFTKHGMVHGTLRLVSDGTFPERLSGEKMPVFRGQAALGEVKLTGIPPDFHLIPGMTAAADIRVGKRRIITYFIYPIMRSLETSLRER